MLTTCSKANLDEDAADVLLTLMKMPICQSTRYEEMATCVDFFEASAELLVIACKVHLDCEDAVPFSTTMFLSTLISQS